MKVNSIIVLYKNTSDHPGKYVLREHYFQGNKYVAVAGEPMATSEYLQPMQELMAAMGRTFVERLENDDQVIVGTYL